MYLLHRALCQEPPECTDFTLNKRRRTSSILVGRANRPTPLGAGKGKSRSRPPSPKKTRLTWGERMDEVLNYTEEVIFPDSDSEDTKLQKVLEEIKKLLEKACLNRLPNTTRLQVQGTYPLPKVAATRSSARDPYLRPEVSSSVKTEDKELAKIQAFVLDVLAPLAPLTAILKERTSQVRSPMLRAANW